MPMPHIHETIVQYRRNNTFFRAQTSIRAKVQTTFCSSGSAVSLPVDSDVVIFFDHDAPKDPGIGRVSGLGFERVLLL